MVGCGPADDAKADGTAPALQVIILGAGGGPDESNTTAFLVRSLASGWRKGSIVAVDAGVHLGAINRILEATQPPELSTGGGFLPHVLKKGPFKGLELPHATPAANAAHVLRTLVDTYLITHPHLDHIAGFVINTAGLPGTRPKRLAGLPSTIAAFKTHIFNNVIWPNLTDENNGAGLVTYNRLVEGGPPALTGDGEGRSYLEISDGLAVKVWGVSHGHCIEKHSHRGSGSSTRFPSFDGSSIGGGGGGGGGGAAAGGVGVGFGLGSASGMMSPRSLAHHNTSNPSLTLFLLQQAAARGETSTTTASHAGGSGALGGSAAARNSSMSMMSAQSESVCVYDSSAYFIRDVATGREVLIFGDVEPDTVSLSPRNGIVWAEAAPKIAAGTLAAVFIECSYEDSQSVDRLFGHMTPRFINEEMTCLASEVSAHRALLSREGRKRKRDNDSIDLTAGVGGGGGVATPAARKKATSRQRGSGGGDDPVSPRTVKPARGTSSSGDDLPPPATLHSHPLLHHPAQHLKESPRLATPTAQLSLKEGERLVLNPGAASSSVGTTPPPQTEPPPPPLQGLQVVIIHVKDPMNDGRPSGEVILEELRAHEAESMLGCNYVIAEFGQALYF